MSACYRLLLLLLCLLPVASESATYYVAPPPTGNAGRSCATITNPATPQAVIATAQACLSGSDELVIRGGTYTNDLCVEDATLPSGSAGAPTRIVGMVGETVTLRVTNGTHCNGQAMIGGNNAHHWEFDNLNLNGVSSLWSCIQPGAPTYFSFRNMTISHCRIGVQSGGSFFSFYNVETRWSGYDEAFNRIDSEYPRGNHGFYFTGDNTTFDKIHSHHNTGIGITLSCEGCGGQVHSNVIKGSSFHHNEGYATLLYSNNAIYDSLIYHNGWNSSSVGVLAAGSATIVNNTIYGNDHAGIMFNHGGSLVRNNIILDNAEGAMVNNGGTGTADHNICNSGCDMSGSAAMFMNAAGGDFRPASSGVASVNAGNATVPTGTPIVDYAGASRTSGGARDVGAYEFVTVAPPNANTIYLAPTGSDANDCFAAENPLTRKQTLASALPCLIVAGKTLELAAGTYPGRIDTGLVPITGGTSSSVRTTIRGAPGATVVIELPVVSGYSAVLRLAQAGDQWLHFDNLTLDALHRPESNGIGLEAGSNNLFTNLTVRNATYQLLGHFFTAGSFTLRDSTLTTAGLDCITLAGSGSGTITLDNNQVSQCQAAGLYDYHAPATLIMTRNILHHAGLEGSFSTVYLEGSTGASLINNILHSTHAGIRLTSGTTGTQLLHNTVHGMTNYGLQCDAGATGTVATNNISVGNGSAVANLCGATLTTNVTTGSPSTIFVNPAAHDYHLIAGSPAINTGTPLPAVATDITGTPRPQGPAWDAGAFEFVAVPVAPTLTITTPTSAPTYPTVVTPLTALGGTASDNEGVISVSWTCTPTSGTCTPTSGTALCGSCGATATSVTWTVASIGLPEGDSVITVTPHDAGGVGTPDSLTVTKSTPPAPLPPGGPATALFFY